MSRPAAHDARADHNALPVEDTRELARGALVMTGVTLVFAVAGIGIFIETGDLASAAGAGTMLLLAAMMIQGRRQLLRGQPRRAAMLLVAAVLAGVLISAPIPPPVPGLAAAPIMAVAFALSFLDGRRLKVALIAAWVVSLIVAIVVEVTPSSPDLPAEFATGLRVGTMVAVVGLVGFILYRHRMRLEQAVGRAEAATDALRDSEARYRTVVEDVRDVIFRIDADGRWALLNHAWEDLTGNTVADTIGRPVLGFVHADDRDREVDLVHPATLSDTDEYRREMRLLAADGRAIWVEVRARPVHDVAGLSIGMSGTLTDVTVRHDLEERLVQQAFHDDLTGLANRALFKDRVEHALTRRSHGPGLVALLFLDPIGSRRSTTASATRLVTNS